MTNDTQATPTPGANTPPGRFAKHAAFLVPLLIVALYYAGLAVYCWANPDTTLSWDSPTIFCASFMASALFTILPALAFSATRAPESLVNRAGGGAFTALALCAVALVSFTESEMTFFQDSVLATSARQTVLKAQASLGEAPAVKSRVFQITSSRQAVEDNREFLRSITTAETDQGAIVAWLDAAANLQVDDAFVSQNAMIRTQDQRRMFNQAIERARSGDADALAWIARQRR